MNQKGITLVELLVSFSIITILSLGLFKATLSIEEKQMINISKNNFVSFNSIINNSIQNDFLTKEINSFTQCGTNCYEIKYKGNEIKKLELNKDKKIISYGDVKEKLPNNYFFYDDIKLTEYTSTDNESNSYILLNIPIRSNFDSNKKDIKIMYQYNGTDIFNFGLEVDLNGGSTTQEFETIYNIGTNIELQNPTKKGYTFTGWQIVSGDSILSGNNLIIGGTDTVIKATYSPITYTINYSVGNDSSGNNYPNVGTYDSMLTIKNPSRTGYIFDGWMATNIDTTTAKYGTTSPNTIWNGTTKVKDTYFINLRSSDGTVTMNANYTATSQTLTVNLNGGTTTQSFKGTYKTNEVITLTNPTRTGYTFTGWSVTSGNSILSGNKLTMGSQNTTITANWERIELKAYIRNLYNTAASENGLVKDDTDDENIRYAGSNDVVKNYVSFDGEIWRIIGIVEGKVKLVKEESIGSYSWDSSSSNKNSGNGYNIWETKEGKTKPDGTTKADINILLNEGYYGGSYSSTCYGGRGNTTTECPTTYINPTLKTMVDENAIWYLGGHSTDSVGVKEIYNYERETKIYESHKEISKIEWMGAVGLIYASDYGYAVDRTKCNEIFTDYNESICKDNNWLYKKIYYWTMLISNVNSYGAFSVTSFGAISFSGFRYFSLDVFPTIYLKNTVKYLSGKGTSTDPYILTINE